MEKMPHRTKICPKRSIRHANSNLKYLINRRLWRAPSARVFRAFLPRFSRVFAAFFASFSRVFRAFLVVFLVVFVGALLPRFSRVFAELFFTVSVTVSRRNCKKELGKNARKTRQKRAQKTQPKT